ncbi:MAG: glycosyltransferase family 9 protein [Bacteroidota bacterium]
MHQFKKILIIQTAFIGDVILATSLIEKIHQYFPEGTLHFLLRKGNEGLLKGHPYIAQLLIWNKSSGKTANLLKLTREVRRSEYDLVINLQRFFSSGILAGFSGAKKIVGFKKNPLSFLFTDSIQHTIGDGTHEVERNLKLIESFTDGEFTQPKLYLNKDIKDKVREYQREPFITIAPTSVWFTKQYPAEKWVEFLDQTAFEGKVFLLGGAGDFEACEKIKAATSRKEVINLCGKLGLLESAALMEKAQMNYVNDSAPQHLASAVDAPTCTIFCSTVPAFGFGPLSELKVIIETKDSLSCRPCGLHGHKSCPEGHFKCALTIETSSLESAL